MDVQAEITSYRDLLVWQRAMDIAESCYALTKLFPREELYGLVSQIRRSAASVAANIAEGYGRDSGGSYVQFLKNAQGSLKELETHVILARRVGVLPGEKEQAVLQQTEEAGRMLRALIRAIQRSAA